MKLKQHFHPLAFVASLALFAITCGRTELDEPFDASGTTTGVAGTTGGRRDRGRRDARAARPAAAAPGRQRWRLGRGRRRRYDQRRRPGRQRRRGRHLRRRRHVRGPRGHLRWGRHLGGRGGTSATAGTSGRAGSSGAAGTSARQAPPARPAPPAARPARAGPLPVPCGQTTCIPGAQKCCFQPGGTSSCTDAQATCTGVSVSCLDGAACGQGQVCCLSVLDQSTSCAAPVACGLGLGVALCTSDAQCPALAPNCCRIGGSGICRARACP